MLILHCCLVWGAPPSPVIWVTTLVLILAWRDSPQQLTAHWKCISSITRVIQSVLKIETLTKHLETISSCPFWNCFFEGCVSCSIEVRFVMLIGLANDSAWKRNIMVFVTLLLHTSLSFSLNTNRLSNIYLLICSLLNTILLNIKGIAWKVQLRSWTQWSPWVPSISGYSVILQNLSFQPCIAFSCKFNV